MCDRVKFNQVEWTGSQGLNATVAGGEGKSEIDDKHLLTHRHDNNLLIG